VRESDKATCKKIVVTPGGVEVVVPSGTPLDGPEGVVPYVQRKRRWVFDSVREVEEKHRASLTQQYASGAKLQYRGRWLMLDVKAGDVGQVSINFRSKFHVVVPVGLDASRSPRPSVKPSTGGSASGLSMRWSSSGASTRRPLGCRRPGFDCPRLGVDGAPADGMG
jgi:hypothetical protein